MKADGSHRIAARSIQWQTHLPRAAVIILSLLYLVIPGKLRHLAQTFGSASANARDAGSGLSSISNSIMVETPVESCLLTKNGEILGECSGRIGNNNSVETPAAFCLLIKDDNDILNEWIAYHYHTMNLRRLIVAIDPNSVTSPADTLQPWGEYFGLNYSLWSDGDYMPRPFVEGNYSSVPVRDAKEHVWDWTDEDKRRYDRHIYRQRVFISQCLKKVKEEGMISHTVHIDTDEYIAINPLFWTTANSTVAPEAPTSGSLIRFLMKAPTAVAQDFFLSLRKNDKRTRHETSSCLLMPTLLFGSRERATRETTIAATTTYQGGMHHRNFSWSYSSFESLRWKFHGGLMEHMNGFPKSLMNASAVPADSPIFQDGFALSPHRPMSTCPRQTRSDFNPAASKPLIVNHYLGSLERYLDRPGDARRSESIHSAKANQTGQFSQESEPGGWWIGTWLDHFLLDHGLERVMKVLGDHVAVSDFMV